MLKKQSSFIVFFSIFFIVAAYVYLLKNTLIEEEAAAPKLSIIMGIDIGTTYTRVGAYKYGYVEIIPIDQGRCKSPSWVAFTNKGTLFGEAAKNQSETNPNTTFFDVKRFIGKKFEDEEVQRDMKLVPYKIDNVSGLPCIHGFKPEEIINMVIYKMKLTVEEYVGKSVRYAVITVPAYFNDAQRLAIKVAGNLAGLTETRIIDDPIAAAIGYGLDQKGDEKKNMLVFDLGGGTFDVSILTINNGVFKVLATNGDTRFGGEDFDQRMMEYFIKLIKKKHNKDISNDNQALGKLRKECEQAKRSLSWQNQDHVKIDSLFDGIDFWEPLSRACFEELNNDLFEKTLGPVKKVMEDAGLEKTQIDEIVLVGGSTQIPKVQQLLKDYFNRKKLINCAVNPDEVVAFGAVIHGDIWSRELGEVDNGADYGDFWLRPVKGSEEIDRMSEEEINRMVREAEKWAEEDREEKEITAARNSLETYVYNMRNQINDKDKLAYKLESNDKEKIENATKEALEWLADNKTAKKEDYEEKLKGVTAVCCNVPEEEEDGYYLHDEF